MSANLHNSPSELYKNISRRVEDNFFCRITKDCVVMNDNELMQEEMIYTAVRI